MGVIRDMVYDVSSLIPHEKTFGEKVQDFVHDPNGQVVIGAVVVLVVLVILLCLCVKCCCCSSRPKPPYNLLIVRDGAPAPVNAGNPSPYFK